MWHQDITIGDLHYLRSKFAEKLGSDGIFLNTFNKATEQFYNTKQFAVNGNWFITWGYLNHENEVNYLIGKFDWLDNITEGKLWIFEADMKGAVKSAIKELSFLTNQKKAYFISNDKIRKFTLI